MPDFQVDLTNCDREPIHIPGQIQSHGFLLVIDQQSIIQFFSDNIFSFIPGMPSNLLGQPISNIESLISKTSPVGFITQLINLGKNVVSFEQTNPYTLKIGIVSYNLVISLSGEYYMLEFEPLASDFDIDIQKMIGRSVSEMLADKNLKKLLKNTALQVKHIIQYDRVMIYRFADDGHGEVIAEAKNDGLEPWLGLHYPASDIPKQALELYKLNLTRLIADVNTVPSKISADSDIPLDLTFSQLRAVSPIHIQYLKNMGVASSFSISLIYKKELWGLISCHSYTPRFIDYRSREAAKLIGQILSSALEFRQDEENQQVQEVFKAAVDRLSRYLQQDSRIEDALIKESVSLLDIVNAGGAVLVYEKQLIKLGITPDDKQVTDLIDWVKKNISEITYYTNKLPSIYPAAAANCLLIATSSPPK